MLDTIKVKYLQTVESLKEGGLKHVFQAHPQVFRNRKITPVVMELGTAEIKFPALPEGTNFQFVEITTTEIETGKWSYALESRGMKALYNLKLGFRSFAVADGSKIVGDIWCFTTCEVEKTVSHPEIKMMEVVGITLDKCDVYAFDMVIAPEYRGKNLAIPLQKFLQATLKAEGCQKVYGAYWNDNIPALWMNRVLKYKNLPPKLVSRFFFFMESRPGEGGTL